MDNEQRAHDLAMLYVKEDMKPTYAELQDHIKPKDIYSLYVKRYVDILDKVNRDFPNK